tara:strand:- start:7089 stop:8312 length:1224 start_codon:yes stop_codon:yes gene_type:complete
MSEVLENIVEELQFDRSNWKLTKFGDVTIQQKKKVDRENTLLTRYIKGEHMHTEDLHIREWGNLTDEYLGPAFIRKFEKGDVLYGSRRTYLRKVAIADFDGITSNTTFVIKANEKKLDKRLLPFIMLSEGFAENSIKNSKGSVNPYVNWKDLAKYEFLLPPLDQQAELAELLWAMDEVVEKENDNLDKIVKAKNAYFDNALYSKSENRDPFFGIKKSKFDVLKLGKLLSEIQYGISESLSEVGLIPILRMNNLQDGKLDISDLKYYNPKKGELDRFILKKGDILFNRTNSFDLVGKVSIFNVDGEYSFASYLIRLKADDSKLDSRFLNFYLNTPIGLAKIRKYRTPGVSQSNINAQNLRHIPIPLPTRKIQETLMNKIESIELGESLSISKISSSKVLQKSLINQVF